ncbi:MAG: diguanylate cyclase [Thermodesulfobacteriota bacterium]
MLSRILLAGGDQVFPPPARVLLEAKGYTVKTCPSYALAIGQILEDPPDILFVAHGFAGGMEADLIQAAKACLHKTNIPVVLLCDGELASLDWQTYPVDDLMTTPVVPGELVCRIELAEARMLRASDNNPLTRLPGNTSIIRAINRTLASDEEYAVCYVDIDNFKPYNDRYGFTQGDEVILMVARIIVNIIDEMARRDSFVGHIGGDDFVFICGREKVAGICEKVISHFEMVKHHFINREDLVAGGYTENDRQGRETRFGLLSLSIAVVSTGPGKYRHYGEISASASQIKHCVKQLEGSNYLIDRRSSYGGG